MLHLPLDPAQGKDRVGLAGGDDEDRVGDTVGDPLANIRPEERGLRSVPEDLDPQVPVFPRHESLPDLLMEGGALLPEGFGEEQLSVKNQRGGSELHRFGGRDSLQFSHGL